MILIHRAVSCDYTTDEMADLVRGLGVRDAYVEIVNYLEGKPYTEVTRWLNHIALIKHGSLQALFAKGTTCSNPDCPHEIHEFYEGSRICKKCTIERTRLRNMMDRRKTLDCKIRYLKTVFIDQRASTVFNWIKKGKIDSAQFRDILMAVDVGIKEGAK